MSGPRPDARCAGCGMAGNAYTLPYTLGLPSWAHYLQTVGDAAVFGAAPAVPYAWQPCSTAPNCGLCSAQPLPRLPGDSAGGSGVNRRRLMRPAWQPDIVVSPEGSAALT